MESTTNTGATRAQRSARRSPAESAESKAKMLAAAERLFAEGGVNGVSFREIATAAGQRNHFAVQYHFGTREGLIQAIFDHRMFEMEPIRGRMLAKARTEHRLGDTRALVEIVYLPQLELRDEDGRHSYAGFLSQYLMRTRSHRFGEFSSATPPHLAETLERLRERLAHLPEAAAQRRLVSASLMFVRILAHSGDMDWTERDSEPFQDAVHDTLDQIVRCLEAPLAAPQ
jgi:AcrR family transcriptional regulator